MNKIQAKEVAELGSNKKAAESPFSLYMPTALLKSLKVKAATDDVSIKSLILDAITEKYVFN